MCGRYSVYTEQENIELREIMEEIDRRYNQAPERERMRTGEIFPTHTVPILAAEGAGCAARLMQWGFPKWQGPGVIINARGETAAQKQTFRGPLRTGRCIVPTTGFFEWRHEGGRTKEKYLFRLPEQPMLYLAGLYKPVAQAGAPPTDTFVILTTEANESVRDYHDRMPLILQPEQMDDWLHDADAAVDFVQSPCRAQLTVLSV
jgi:putative SOS response-associated peptidase YedK